MQRAVWRNGGSNSAESAVRIRTEAPRRTFSVSRRCAKPPPRWLQVSESVGEKIVRKIGRQSSKKIAKTFFN
jgi:hypothetical protein